MGRAFVSGCESLNEAVGLLLRAKEALRVLYGFKGHTVYTTHTHTNKHMYTAFDTSSSTLQSSRRPLSATSVL